MPNLNELPPPPPGHIGWPWTVESPEFPPMLPDDTPWFRVSIVTPSYNQAAYIEETIRSVLLQGYPDLEYSILDGGSTDGTIDIIKKYEQWLTFWVSEKDKGQADAINKGWQKSTGEILAYLNSDDTYTPGAIRRAVEYLHSHPNIAAVNGAYNYVDESSKWIQQVPSVKFDLKLQLRGNMICQPTVYIRREPLFKLGLLDTRLHYVMDFDLWLKIGLSYHFGCMDAIQANFRIVQSAKSTSHLDKFLPEILGVLDSFFAQPGLPEDIQKIRTLAYSDYYAHEVPHPLYRPRDQMSPEQIRKMRWALWESIRWHPLRRKTIWTMTQILDSYLNTHLAELMTRKWIHIKSGFSGRKGNHDVHLREQ